MLYTYIQASYILHINIYMALCIYIYICMENIMGILHVFIDILCMSVYKIFIYIYYIYICIYLI